MRIRQIVAVVVFCTWVMSSTGVGAQAGREQPGREPFMFRQGQSVYVTAFHAIEHSARHSKTLGAGALIDNHLPAEFRIRNDFEKRRVYRLVNKASEADFVFLVLIDDSAAEGLAVAPREFAALRPALDIGALREAAYARSIVGPLKIHNLGRLSDHLVKPFHEQEGLPTKTSPDRRC